MPALNNLALAYDICVHATATEFLEATEYALVDQERRSNLILAHALERAAWEASHAVPSASVTTLTLAPPERSRAWWIRRLSQAESTSPVGCDFWMTCWTIQTPATGASRTEPLPITLRPPTLDLAISILASDPVFVFTPHPASSLGSQFLAPRARALVQRLAQYVPRERMSRVFALYSVAETMADAWSIQTGISRVPENQCNVFSTFCTVATFSGVQPIPEGHRVGGARAPQVSQLAHIYHDFEKESALRPISYDRARRKVEEMIQQDQLWIYEYPVLDASMTRVESYRICAIAALTRHTPAMAAISCIYTLPQARGQRIAERLVGTVCNHVFAMNKSAVLFVPQGNTAASNLLGRVGFYGMGSRAELGEEAETWREIGFEGGI